MATFASRLNGLRKEYEKRQDDIAKYLGVTRASISAYEKEKVYPPYETIRKLADFFNVSIDYMTGESDVKKIMVDESKDVDISILLRNLLYELEKTDSRIVVDGKPISDKIKMLLKASISTVMTIAEANDGE